MPLCSVQISKKRILLCSKQKINSKKNNDLTGSAKSYTAKIAEYNIRSVPTIIVNGRYQINHDVMASPERFQELIKYLLALNHLKVK